MNWTKIMECVPNFSEGRDHAKIDQIVEPFRHREGVKLLDYSNDEDHNRLVVTVVGQPDALKEAVIEAIGVIVPTQIHIGKVIIIVNNKHPLFAIATLFFFVPHAPPKKQWPTIKRRFLLFNA